MRRNPVWDFFNDSAAIARRDMIRVRRQPELATFGTTMGVFFLVLFNFVFGGAIEAGTGVRYEQFLLPGILVLVGLFGANQAGVGLAEDMQKGVTDRFRSLPMRQGAVLAGRAASDLMRNVVSLIPTIVLGYVIGFRFDSILGALACVVLVLVLGTAFSWINMALGAKIRSVEVMNMLGMMWLMPLMFASSIFTPTNRMPGWLQAFANNQPISLAANATRDLANGSNWTWDATGSLIWAAGLTAVFAVVGGRAYQRP